MDKQGPKFNENNIYRVRRLFLCKLVLKKHGSVQIEGMGESISLVSKLAQILSKNKLAVIKSIASGNVEREGSHSINPKLTVKLDKSAEFDKLTQDLVLKQ